MAITKQRANRQKILNGIGQRLEMVRKRFHITSKEMAEKMGIQTKAYYRHEKGETMPGPVALERLQQELDISLNWLVFNRGPETQNDKMEETIKMVEEEMPEVKELLDAMRRDQVLRHKVMLFFYDYREKEKSKSPKKEK